MECIGKILEADVESTSMIPSTTLPTKVTWIGQKEDNFSQKVGPQNVKMHSWTFKKLVAKLK